MCRNMCWVFCGCHRSMLDVFLNNSLYSSFKTQSLNEPEAQIFSQVGWLFPQNLDHRCTLTQVCVFVCFNVSARGLNSGPSVGEASIFPSKQSSQALQDQCFNEKQTKNSKFSINYFQIYNRQMKKKLPNQKTGVFLLKFCDHELPGLQFPFATLNLCW